ncbi:aromatic compound dioxygenase [Armillaria borealis]|uniref:Aromatic compound dioxygenase n=1 Tax=Armillaria borealis TaxID=47425 RepID=A0AA39K766_9AGAR|nr:aromatic compound dioxygenase [Armillaria borealis]
MVCFPSIASFVLLAATTVAGNPGAAPLSGTEVARSSELHQAARRSLGACQDTLFRRDKMEKSAARRTALVDEKRCLVTRAPYKRTITSDNVSSTTHLSSEANLTMELDQGMSYVQGEYVRSTISEDQSGVYTYVDLELIDVSTCETAPDLYIDFWHCNSRTKSSSVASSQPTKRDTRPSRLSSRATILECDPFRHGHPQPRNCIRQRHFYPPSVHYIGQIFFDQDLISSVEATSPYKTNIIEITTNSVDQVFVLGFGSTILEYLYLGDDISDGFAVLGCHWCRYEHNFHWGK